MVCDFVISETSSPKIVSVYNVFTQPKLYHFDGTVSEIGWSSCVIGEIVDQCICSQNFEIIQDTAAIIQSLLLDT